MIGYIAVFLLGVLVTACAISRLMAGTVVVYVPDQEGEVPYLTAELERSVGAIANKKCVLFKVDVRYLNSQE